MCHDHIWYRLSVYMASLFIWSACVVCSSEPVHLLNQLQADTIQGQKCLSCLYVIAMRHQDGVSVCTCKHVYCMVRGTFLSLTDVIVNTGCCTTLDHILTFLFKRLSKNKGLPISPSHHTNFLRILELQPEILQQMLSSVMDIIMFENCRTQWSMSRPLLGLILLNEEVCMH